MLQTSMALAWNLLKRLEHAGNEEQDAKTDVLPRKHLIKFTLNKGSCPSGQHKRESDSILGGTASQRFRIHSPSLATIRRQTVTFVRLSFVMSLMLTLAAAQNAGEVIDDPTLTEPGSVKVVPVQGDQVQDLCDAQCAAMCITLGDDVCEDICGKSGQRRSRSLQCSWLLKCQHSGCTGSCSTMPQTDSDGPVPDTPRVSVTRDSWTGHINISWPLYNLNSTEITVYLVSQKTGYCSWAQLGWVIGNRYIVTNIPDLCTLPTYRVAAVSRFGSRWFSKEVETPELVPGPPRDLKVYLQESTDVEDRDEAIFNLEWKPPEDWPLDNLQFDLMSSVDCPALIDEVSIYRDKTLVKVNLENEALYVVTGRIPLHAIGCKITFLIGSKPMCNGENRVKARSMASTKFPFECSALPTYRGDLCNVPPVGKIHSVQGTGVYPSPVRNVTLMVLPVPGQKLLARVFWLPPQRLGSAGYVDAYYLFWGLVELGQSELIATFKSDILSTIVPGDQLKDELLLNISSFQPYETLGVVIQAAGPNQSFAHPFSNIHKSINSIPPNYNFSPEDIIANDSTVYVIQTTDVEEPKVKVDVFWLRPELSMGLDVASYQVTLQPKHIDSSAMNETSGMGPDDVNETSTRYFDTTVVKPCGCS